MKMVFAIVAAMSVLVSLTGCSSEINTSHNHTSSYTTTTATSEEKEILEVDEYDISLDEVDSLCKELERKSENAELYRKDYSNATYKLDNLLDKIEYDNTLEYDINSITDIFGEVCDAGIGCCEAKAGSLLSYFYWLFWDNGELTDSEKDFLRKDCSFAVRNKELINQCREDMKKAILAATEEKRNLTPEEIEEVKAIYKIVADKVDATKY